MQKHDAILFLSFGGPEGPDDVIPFLERVTHGRGIPRERLAEVGEHYNLFGGVSPINAQNKDIIERLERELASRGTSLPIYFGNRNWHPLLDDTVQKMATDGIQHPLVFVTSAYGGYSGCRQYQENLEAAFGKIDAPMQWTKTRLFYAHPEFVNVNTRAVSRAIDEVATSSPYVLFTAHSIPTSMASQSAYVQQIELVMNEIVATLGLTKSELVWQSRSGPPHIPWLEPDICDRMEALTDEGESGFVVAPIGFISDHMEVLYDLDTEAKDLAKELGVVFERADTAAQDPKFIEMIAELLEEHTHGREPRFVGPSPRLGPCPKNCCPAPVRRPRPAAT